MSGDLDKIRSYINEIDVAAKHLVTMIHNVLDVSGGSGAFTLAEEPFLFSGMLDYIIGRVSPDMTKKNQTLSLYISPDMPETLVGDEKRITQVIIHLLSNASKFSHIDSKINLSAFVQDMSDNTITLWFDVKDNGIGISDEQQQNLFELFEQADGGNTRKYGGIGIGLPLSKCIVELMGGVIWVESELDKGSKFSFTCVVRV